MAVGKLRRIVYPITVWAAAFRSLSSAFWPAASAPIPGSSAAPTAISSACVASRRWRSRKKPARVLARAGVSVVPAVGCLVARRVS